MLEIDQRSGFSLLVRVLLQKSKTIEPRSHLFDTSGATLSSPQAFPSFILVLAILYSSRENGSVLISRGPRIVYISSSAFSTTGDCPSSDEK